MINSLCLVQEIYLKIRKIVTLNYLNFAFHIWNLDSIKL